MRDPRLAPCPVLVLALLVLAAPVRAQEGDEAWPTDVDKARASLRVTARHMTEAMLAEAPPEARAMMREQLGVSDEVIVEMFVEHTYEVFEGAFEVGAEQAAALLAGRFRDEDSRARIEEALKRFDELGVALPLPLVYCLEHREELEGWELEYARRVVDGQLAKLAGALEEGEGDGE